MQVYEGLDILTNKATEEEMQGIPHYMIGVVNRSEKFDVVKFRDMALPIVEDILSRGKIPFIVGGTNYYIESLLWKVLMNENHTEPENEGNSENSAKKAKLHPSETISIFEFMEERKGNFTESEMTEKWSETELHQALEEVDPKRALKIHPNDRRKVVRSLQLYFRTGRPHSELIEEQCSTGSDEELKDENLLENVSKTSSSLSGKLGGPLRFENSLCLWIQAERDILNKRIEERVDKMVDRGIKGEIDDFVDRSRKDDVKWDFQLGQLQSIGIKEFQSYIQLPPNERETSVGRKDFMEGLERLKIVTKQYAKRQVQWMTQRFLKSARRQVPAVYGLDGNKTDEDSWDANVTIPAKEILDAYSEGNLDKPLLKDKRVEIAVDQEDVDFVSRKCEACDKILLGSSQWKEHTKSSKHWKIVNKRKKEFEKLSVLLANRSVVLNDQDVT